MTNPGDRSCNQGPGFSADSFLLAASIAAGLCITAWVLWRCRFGYDLTDEGAYLTAISNPSIYKATATQYGFVYHPLYELVGGNIAFLRHANVLLTLGL